MSGARRLRPILRLVAPILAVLGIVALDLVAAVRSWPIPVKGLLDEPAHLLTACVALSVYAPGRTRAWPWVLLGAVAIDLDHIPLYLWGGPVATGGGRPVTHSATTVAALLVIALVVPKVRTAASGLAAGVLLHFVRDIATGPGVPLLWPLHPDPVLLPYGTYLVALTALATLGTSRQLHQATPSGLRRDDLDNTEHRSKRRLQ